MNRRNLFGTESDTLFAARETLMARTERSMILVVVLCLSAASVRIATAQGAGPADVAEIISKENSVDSAKTVGGVAPRDGGRETDLA